MSLYTGKYVILFYDEQLLFMCKFLYFICHGSNNLHKFLFYELQIKNVSDMSLYTGKDVLLLYDEHKSFMCKFVYIIYVYIIKEFIHVYIVYKWSFVNYNYFLKISWIWILWKLFKCSQSRFSNLCFYLCVHTCRACLLQVNQWVNDLLM